jgi:hypothetical protein
MSESLPQHVGARLGFETDSTNHGSRSCDAHESQMWPIFQRLCAVADYLQLAFPDSLLPACIRRSPCHAVDELHIIQ